MVRPGDRANYAALDAADPLAATREAFELPAGLIYLDGNSLGPLPRQARAIATRVIDLEWGRDLIKSWNSAGWFELPRRLGDKLARLIGADAGEVVVTDSISINLFKLLAAALKLRPERRVIVSERGNFPTDLYIAEGITRLLDRGYSLRLIHDRAELDRAALDRAVDADVACVMLTHVDYRTGAMHDMSAVTRLAQDRGALMLWDLAHSAGAVPVELNPAHADFAVGCTYKYLNGGPGSPAFLFVAKRWQAQFEQPLSGWWGHAKPFEFASSYRPAADVARYLCGTQPVISMSVLEAGLDVALSVDPAAVRAKSIALCEHFIALVEAAQLGVKLASPRDAAERGSQVSFLHAEGYAIMQALIARNVIGDYREPSILRFGFAPLYVRYVDVFDAAQALIEILHTRSWDDPRFKTRAAVT